MIRPAELIRSSTYPQLKRFILEHTGLSYYADRDDDLATRVLHRLNTLESPSAGEYLRRLGEAPEELDLLVAELTIGETYFFRQPEHFDLIRRVILPELLEARREQRRIRIWSAGCAAGAEPYTIAILLRTEFEDQLAGWDVSILGTDINVDFLARAQEGRFTTWALRETPPDIQARCFEPEGKLWRLKPEFRRRVQFSYHNLISDHNPLVDSASFDLILCRNVLIYFSQETIRAVARHFFDALNDTGRLLVGHAETNSENFSIFETVNFTVATMYVKHGDRPRTQRPALLDPVPQPVLPWAPPDLSEPWTPRHSSSNQQPTPVNTPALTVDEVRALADHGDRSTARHAAESLVHADPLNAAAHFTLGLILEQQGEAEAARDSLRKAIYLDRSFMLAQYHLGTWLQAAGDHHAATRALTAAQRMASVQSPSDPLPHGDGMTAGELIELVKVHLGLMSK